MVYDIRNGTFLAIVVALILNLLVYFVGRSLLDVPFTVAQDPSVVTLMPIIIVTIITTIGAGLVAWLLQRTTDNFVRIFLWLAAILALLSLIPVYSMAIGRPSFFSLGLMHVITAASAVYGLLYFSSCDNCEEENFS